MFPPPLNDPHLGEYAQDCPKICMHWKHISTIESPPATDVDKAPSPLMLICQWDISRAPPILNKSWYLEEAKTGAGRKEENGKIYLVKHTHININIISSSSSSSSGGSGSGSSIISKSNNHQSSISRYHSFMESLHSNLTLFFKA